MEAMNTYELSIKSTNTVQYKYMNICASLVESCWHQPAEKSVCNITQIGVGNNELQATRRVKRMTPPVASSAHHSSLAVQNVQVAGSVEEIDVQSAQVGLLRGVRRLRNARRLRDVAVHSVRRRRGRGGGSGGGGRGSGALRVRRRRPESVLQELRRRAVHVLDGERYAERVCERHHMHVVRLVVHRLHLLREIAKTHSNFEILHLQHS